jgi:hypothetical protein
MSGRTRFRPYLHNLKFPLDFIVVCIALERLFQLFYLMGLIDMASASESEN